MLQGWYFGTAVKEVNKVGELPHELQVFTTVNNRQAELVAITEEGKRVAQLSKIRNGSAQTMEALTRLERNIRFFFLCLIFMYFRTLHVVQKEKETWLNVVEETIMSEERKAMIQEEKAAEYRKEAFDYAFRKFQLGAKRRQRKAATEELQKVRQVQTHFLLTMHDIHHIFIL